MRATYEKILSDLNAKLSEVAGQPLFVIQFANGFCMNMTDGSACGSLQCTVFDNPVEAEQTARTIRNGNNERPAAMPYELAIKACIADVEQCLVTWGEWETRVKNSLSE